MAKLAGDHVQVLVDGYELTGDSNRLNLSDARDMYDISSFGDAIHRFIPGRRAISLEHAGYLDAGAAQSHEALNGAAVSGVVSVLLGDNQAPADGDLVFSLAIRQGKYSVIPAVGNVVPFAATFANRGELGGWGVALGVPQAFNNASQTGSGVDHGAQSALGGAAYLHVLTPLSSGDSYTVTVEGSASGAFAGEESTLATFSLDGTARGSEFVLISGAIPQVTRWKAVRSGANGDNIQIAVSLVRF